MKISLEIDDKEIAALSDAALKLEHERRQQWQPMVVSVIDKIFAAIDQYTAPPPPPDGN